MGEYEDKLKQHAAINESGNFRPKMTPREELHTKLFLGGKVLVKDMDDLQLRAHIEELSDICFRGRVALSAARDEVQERIAKKKGKGFSTSLATDDVTSELINNVKERQKKLTKIEKLIEKLMEMPGITRETAERMVSAGHQLELRESKKVAPVDKVDKVDNPIQEPTKTLINPFKK